MLPDEYLARIGHVVLSFERLEKNMAVWLTLFISTDVFVGIIVTSEVGFRELVRLFKAIYIHLYKEDQDFEALKNLLERAKKAKKLRDQVVHSGYTHMGDRTDKSNHITRFKVTAKESKGYQRQFEKLTPQAFDRVITEIDAVNRDFLAWCNDLNAKKKIPHLRKV
jgi:hypothetical protein